MKGADVAVVLAGGGKPKMGKGMMREEPSGEVDLEDEEDTSSDPIDLFIEAMGGTPSAEARKAFKLAVQSCSDSYEE